MADLIDRQAAIDAMLRLEQEDIDAYGAKIREGFDAEPAVEALKALPSAQPERKTGRWIKNDNPLTAWHRCSTCDYLSWFGTYNYCPNCGARMGGE